MYTPTVHSNGTSKSALVAQQRAVMTAARAFMDALREADPHGRDYYVQGDGAYTVARDEHLAVVLAVQKVHDDAQTRALAIMAQGRQD